MGSGFCGLWFCGNLVLEIDVLWIGIWLKPGFRKSRFCGNLVLENRDFADRDFGNHGFEDRVFWNQVLENLGWKI